MKVRDSEIYSSERELVRDAQRGDRRAFKRLYDLYRDRVYTLAYYTFGDSLSAEDLLQTVFLKVHRGLGGFRFESSLATWVYRIALNECLNQQRRRGAEYVPLESILGRQEEFDSRPAPDIRHLEHQSREIIREAVMGLPPKLRTVVVMKYVEDFSYQEIADALGCSTGTVASRLNRALARLEQRLGPLRRLL
ncbi:MAG: hypothetical protein DMF61_22380 [Blastocatellia bacterium AA13]|nr:MAG: hypothetical protein DMF61_22380 [Blastocatellia bacterium AA13]